VEPAEQDSAQVDPLGLLARGAVSVEIPMVQVVDARGKTEERIVWRIYRRGRITYRADGDSVEFDTDEIEHRDAAVTLARGETAEIARANAVHTARIKTRRDEKAARERSVQPARRPVDEVPPA
jgi:hypothetical protein